MRSNFQHYRKRRKVMTPAYHEAMAAHFAADFARRVALPERPADPVAGEEWVSVAVTTRRGLQHIELRIPAGRARSDQFRVLVDGEVVAEREGVTAILARIGAMFRA
jgi:hypothetical protein